MNDYFSNGEIQAYTLPNRGPLKFTDDGELHPAPASVGYSGSPPYGERSE